MIQKADLTHYWALAIIINQPLCISDCRTFESALKNSSPEEKISVFSERTDPSSAEQYFQAICFSFCHHFKTHLCDFFCKEQYYALCFFSDSLTFAFCYFQLLTFVLLLLCLPTFWWKGIKQCRNLSVCLFHARTLRTVHSWSYGYYRALIRDPLIHEVEPSVKAAGTCIFSTARPTRALFVLDYYVHYK